MDVRFTGEQRTCRHVLHQFVGREAGPGPHPRARSVRELPDEADRKRADQGLARIRWGIVAEEMGR
jgi:hypothetical protein